VFETSPFLPSVAFSSSPLLILSASPELLLLKVMAVKHWGRGGYTGGGRVTAEVPMQLVALYHVIHLNTSNIL